MGHYRIAPLEINRLDFADAFQMYQAALTDEQRRGAWALLPYAEKGKGLQDLMPWAFPELPGERKSKLHTKEFMEASTLHSLERIMRQHGCDLEAAKRRAKWYHGPIGSA